jgi:hypothetical protein
MFQKWFRVLIMIGILFSYLPVMPVEHCPEGSHEGNHHEANHQEESPKEQGMLHCGQIFHCPFTFNLSFSEPLVILNTEKLESILSSITFGDFRFPIFHPPEGKVKESILI